jgi:RNA polymerase sigma factor (sigma-70 family)
MNHDERFEALYRRYYARVVRYLTRAFRLTVDEAIDIAQDVFLRVFAVAADYSEDQSWHFIETVARNVGLNRLRQTRSYEKVTPAIADRSRDRFSHAPAEAESQEKAVVPGGITPQLEAAINNLPAAQRSVLLLWLDQFTYVEIAQFLGISLDAVKSRLGDARRHLRHVLAFDDTDAASVHDAAPIVASLARQSLVEASVVSSDGSVEDALQKLLERIDALSAQRQHLSRQIDEYDAMLARHSESIAELSEFETVKAKRLS